MTQFSDDLALFQSETSGRQEATSITDPLAKQVEAPVSEVPDFQLDLGEFRKEVPQSLGVAEEVGLRVQKQAGELQIQQASQQDNRRLPLEGDLPSTVRPTDFSKIEGGQESVIADSAPVTQAFGNSNPDIEVFSGGINFGTDFGTQKGTNVAAPPGQWTVQEAYANARRDGFIGNSENNGFGNSVSLVNDETGERIRFSHLDVGGVGVKPGQRIKGGQVFAKTGNTGNSTGPHLDVEYYDDRGQVRDVLKSPYKKFLLGQGGGHTEGSGGGGDFLRKALNLIKPDDFILTGTAGEFKQKSEEEKKKIVGQSLFVGMASPIGGTRTRFIPKQLLRKEEVGIIDDVLSQFGQDKVFLNSNKNFVSNILKQATNATDKTIGKLTNNQRVNEIIKLANMSEDFFSKNVASRLGKSRIGRTITNKLGKSRLK